MEERQALAEITKRFLSSQADWPSSLPRRPTADDLRDLY
jgi:hypothetical protein